MAFVCTHVLNREKPVLLIIHENDGGWQLLCGETGHEPDTCRIIHFHHVQEAVKSDLAEVMDLKEGQMAERDTPFSAWKRGPFTSE